jgi:hypothetical protein
LLVGKTVVKAAHGRAQTFLAALEGVAFAESVVYIGYAKEPVVYETRLFIEEELDTLGSRKTVTEDFHASDPDA